MLAPMAGENIFIEYSWVLFIKDHTDNFDTLKKDLHGYTKDKDNWAWVFPVGCMGILANNSLMLYGFLHLLDKNSKTNPKNCNNISSGHFILYAKIVSPCQPFCGCLPICI